MRSPASGRPSLVKSVLNVSALALLAGAGAACSTSAVRLSEPVFTGSTSNQQQLIGQAAEPQPSYALAANPAPQPSYALAPSQGVARERLAPIAAPQAPSAPQTYAASGLPQPVGPVVRARPAAYAPAEEPEVASADIPSGADLPAGYKPSGAPVELGRITVPRERPRGAVASAKRRAKDTAVASASPKAQPAAYTPPRKRSAEDAAPAPKGGGSYTVRNGDSLWTIARAHGVSTADIIAANKLKDPDLQVGQTLVMPGAARGTQVASIDPAQPVAAAPAPEPAAQPAASVEAPEAAPEPVEAAPAPAAPPAAEPRRDQPAAEAPDPDSGKGFRWPVRGRVIAGFGKKPNGERNDGINLAVPEGTPVKAAEAGTVIYAGSELKNYGNLILVRHANGFVSAYAHNAALQVKRGEKVRRGQVIATSGRSGDVSAPQVHFELRKGATPVNPLDYLSS